MVLKRLLVTTLGALGMGAFVAGTATAQTPGEGNIPAPDLFDPQVECSTNLQMTPATLAKAVADLVKAGTAVTVEQVGGVDTGTPDAASGLANAVFVIDPHYPNCGAGNLDTDGDGDVDADDMGVPGIAGAIGKDVAEGYVATLEAFEAANAADAAVKTAEGNLKTLVDALAAGAADTPAVTEAREALATAQAAQTTEHTNLYAIGAGPIYRAGIAEWRAKGAVESAVKAYNMAVRMANTAGSATQLGDLEYAGYVPLRDETTSYLTTQVVDSMGVVNTRFLRLYANAEGDRVATQGDGGTFGGEGNFDNAGNLLVPMIDSDPDTEGDQLVPIKVSGYSYTDINTRSRRY